MATTIKINHRDAESCVHLGINKVPSYLSNKMVCEILSGYTKYNLSVSSVREVIYDAHKRRGCIYVASCMEEAIDIIKRIKLYTIEEKYEWKHEINCVETIQFRLSDIFNIKMSKDNPWNTFFLVECDKPDVSFNDTRLKEDLHVNVAKSGFYYLPGNWRFNRINEEIVEAKRFKENVIRIFVGKTRVEI